MITLDTFEAELLKLIGKPTELRPFICAGSPLECKVFIVGFNPATEMRREFWAFWRAGYGFDREAWQNEYIAERKSRPLREGQIRRSDLSNTRRVINWVLEGARNVRCLETNIYALATEKAAELSSRSRITAPFDFLMNTIQPKLILVHGKDAAMHARNFNYDKKVIEVSHFSRGWSRAHAIALGQEIANEVPKKNRISMIPASSLKVDVFGIESTTQKPFKNYVLGT